MLIDEIGIAQFKLGIRNFCITQVVNTSHFVIGNGRGQVAVIFKVVFTQLKGHPLAVCYIRLLTYIRLSFPYRLQVTEFNPRQHTIVFCLLPVQGSDYSHTGLTRLLRVSQEFGKRMCRKVIVSLLVLLYAVL
ncbi:hypothetical protein D3C86_1087320 [compost metagenome]